MVSALLNYHSRRGKQLILFIRNSIEVIMINQVETRHSKKVGSSFCLASPQIRTALQFGEAFMKQALS